MVKASHPQPLLDYYGRRADDIAVMPLAPWGADETAAFLSSKELTGDAARIAEIAGGRPGYIAELIDLLSESGSLDGDLSEVTLASLAPLNVDEDELEVPDEPAAEGERKHQHGAGAV